MKKDKTWSTTVKEVLIEELQHQFTRRKEGSLLLSGPVVPITSIHKKDHLRATLFVGHIAFWLTQKLAPLRGLPNRAEMS